MLNHNQIQRDQTRLRLLALLAKNGKLSWSQLLMSTELNKNTISNQLAELRRGGWIEESIGRTGNRGRPQLFIQYAVTSEKKFVICSSPLRGFLKSKMSTSLSSRIIQEELILIPVSRSNQIF